MNAPERLTSDITINGRPPTDAEWAAHLRLLRELAHGGASALMATTLQDYAEHRAFAALHRHGLIRNRSNSLSGFSFDTIEITDLGRVYLRQRS